MRKDTIARCGSGNEDRRWKVAGRGDRENMYPKRTGLCLGSVS